jgi:hypothetical protein
MKIEKTMKIFCLRLRGECNINLLNLQDELSFVIGRLNDSLEGIINLNYLFDLNYVKSTFRGEIKNEKMKVNLFQNFEHQISILEIESGYNFTLDDIGNSPLFIENIELMNCAGIFDNFN